MRKECSTWPECRSEGRPCLDIDRRVPQESRPGSNVLALRSMAIPGWALVRDAHPSAPAWTSCSRDADRHGCDGRREHLKAPFEWLGTAVLPAHCRTLLSAVGALLGIRCSQTVPRLHTPPPNTDASVLS